MTSGTLHDHGNDVYSDFSMHDYSRDIMLANAQQDMEENLKKMQLNKKIALTKSNEDKAASLKKQNDELGFMFLPTQVSVDILQGKIYCKIPGHHRTVKILLF